MGQPRNLLCQKWYRGFESLLLRHLTESNHLFAQQKRDEERSSTKRSRDGAAIPTAPPSERSSTNYPAQPELGMKNAVRRKERMRLEMGRRGRSRSDEAQPNQSRLLRHLTESNELILNRTNEPSTYRCRT